MFIFKGIMISTPWISVALSSTWNCAEVLWMHYLCKLGIQQLHLSTETRLQWQRDRISAQRIMRWITCMAALAKLHGFNYLSSQQAHFRATSTSYSPARRFPLWLSALLKCGRFCSHTDVTYSNKSSFWRWYQPSLSRLCFHNQSIFLMAITHIHLTY